MKLISDQVECPHCGEGLTYTGVNQLLEECWLCWSCGCEVFVIDHDRAVLSAACEPCDDPEPVVQRVEYLPFADLSEVE